MDEDKIRQIENILQEKVDLSDENVHIKALSIKGFSKEDIQTAFGRVVRRHHKTGDYSSLHTDDKENLLFKNAISGLGVMGIVWFIYFSYIALFIVLLYLVWEASF